MPTKFDSDTWTLVRERMNELLTAGVRPMEAARTVSDECGGHPAPGTIVNRLARGWRSPSAATRNGADKARELRERMREMQAEIDVLRAELEKARGEIASLRADLANAEQEAAKNEGAVEVLKELVSLDTNGHNGNGYRI